MYTLAGIIDEEKGWGINRDTFHCLETLREYGYETWFRLGDRDLAIHIHRTYLLRSSLKLSEVTCRICQALGLKVNILPMSDQKIETVIVTDREKMHFQEYLVKRGAEDVVVNVDFKGVDKAQPAPGVLSSILDADIAIICPSNPIVSIGTILSVKGVRDALKETKARVIAISPIVGGAPIKGPAGKLMRGLGLEVSAYSVASLYKDFLDDFIIDIIDKGEKSRIETLGLNVLVTNTIMKSLQNKMQLAKAVLDLVGK